MTKYEIEIDGIPDGYEPVRLGLPKLGEHYLTTNGTVAVAELDYQFSNRIILRKVKRWRKATLPDDAGKPCRYSDDGETWNSGDTLHGWLNVTSGYMWRLSTGSAFKYCEVEE